MDLKSLESEALGLSSQDRASLALDLIESLEELTPAEVDRLWTQETQRRVAQIDTGAVELVSADVVQAKARALLG